MNEACFPYHCLLSPSILKENEKNISRRTYAICHQSLQRYWHGLYDDMPNLLKTVGNDSNNVLNDFLDWSFRLSLPLDWRLCLWFARWAEIYQENILENNDIVSEIMTKVAARWALSDKSADHCMVVSWSNRISTATVAEKITRIDQEQQVLLVTLHDNPGDDIFIGMFEDIGRFQVNNMREFRNDFTVSKFGAS